MTDLLSVLSAFPTQAYTHLLPSLERHLVSTTDLLTLDALEVARRAHLPALDVRKLQRHILENLHRELGLCPLDAQNVQDSAKNVAQDSAQTFTQNSTRKLVQHSAQNATQNQAPNNSHKAAQKDPQYVQRAAQTGSSSTSSFNQTTPLRSTTQDLLDRWRMVSTLDATLDAALGGGVPAGYLTEIAGESGAGKTQILLTLLLSAQLPRPQGLGRPTLYLSTEHALPTTRLQQMLECNPVLSEARQEASQGPSLEKVLTIQMADLETQDHVLTYQLPVIVSRHNVGLVVIDSIAANYRAEASAAVPGGSDEIVSAGSGTNGPRARQLGQRAANLARTGALLRDLARKYQCAVVVANQVADWFPPATTSAPMQSVAAEMQMTALPSHMLLPSSSLGSTSGSGQGGASARRTEALLLSSSPLSALPSSPSPAHGESQTIPTSTIAHAVDPCLSLDHQLRFFSGWGDMVGLSASEVGLEMSKTTHRYGGDNGSIPSDGPSETQPSNDYKQTIVSRGSPKIPTLGLVWANQVAARIVLGREAVWGASAEQSSRDIDLEFPNGRDCDLESPHGRDCDDKFHDHDYKSSMPRQHQDTAASKTVAGEWSARHWRRWLRVVFAAWTESTGAAIRPIRSKDRSAGDNRRIGFEVWAGGVRAVR